MAFTQQTAKTKRKYRRINAIQIKKRKNCATPYAKTTTTTNKTLYNYCSSINEANSFSPLVEINQIKPSMFGVLVSSLYNSAAAAVSH